MRRRKLSKECLTYIIQHNGQCNSDLCERISCSETCELFKNKQQFNSNIIEFKYAYEKAIDIFIKRYDKEELFEVLL